MKSLLSGVLLVAILFGVFQTFHVAQVLQEPSLTYATPSNTLVVPDSFAKISWAFGNASDGDTVLVRKGTYAEPNLFVNKSLTIVGENAKNTIIDGGGTAQFVFHVIASNVVIENFTLQNTAMSFSVQDAAISVYNATNVKVEDVIIRNVYYGVEMRSSNFTEITYCNISNSSWSGIWLRSRSSNNTIAGNIIENNHIGIGFAEATSQFNVIYHNSFVNNTPQISFPGGVDYFDNGYPSGGNYWSDYSGTDLKHGSSQDQTGSDGIFDESYPVTGDRYPLANPLTILNVQAGDQAFHMQLSTNATVTGYELNISRKGLSLFINDSAGATEACKTLIPKDLLGCENLTDWIITFYDNGTGQALTYLPFEDSKSTYLYFTHSGSTNGIVEMKGTIVAPELSPATMVILLVTATGFVVVAKKQSRKR